MACRRGEEEGGRDRGAGARRWIVTAWRPEAALEHCVSVLSHERTRSCGLARAHNLMAHNENGGARLFTLPLLCSSLLRFKTLQQRSFCNMD